MKKEFKLRPYQEDAVRAAEETDLKRILLVLSTGMGKSYIIAELGRRNLHQHILVFQPNKEILEQNVEKFKLATGKRPAILSASKKSWELGKVTFSTIGTAKNRMQEIAKLGVDLIILDEAQEYPVNSADSMISKLLDEIDFQGKVIGLTATPFITYSGDLRREGLTKDGTRTKFSKEVCLDVLTNNNPFGFKETFWQDILYNTSISDSFEKGFLIKPNYRLWQPSSEIMEKASRLLKPTQDRQSFTEASTKEFDNYMANVYRAYAEKVCDKHKRSVVFVRTVEIAEKLASEVKGGYCISTHTKAKEREEILEKFKQDSDEHLVIFNVSVLGRGFDSPNCEAVAFFTPTRSLIRYMQFVGRCLRPDPNNPEKQAFVYDFDLTNRKGESNSTLRRFGKVEDIHLRKNLFGNWEIFSSSKNEILSGEVVTVNFSVEFKPRWKKKKK